MKHALLKPLHADEILERLIHLGVNNISKIHVLDCVDSTNEYLLKQECNDEAISVCLAEKQNQGRGRYGHKWISPAGVNIYLSLAFPVPDKEIQYDVLSLWLLLAIAKVLETYDIDGIQLKWPNDICVKNKKLAGVLIEKRSVQKKNSLIVGIGLNVAMSTKNSIELNRPWTDLYSIKPDIAMSRNEIAAGLIVSLSQTIYDFVHLRLKNLAERWQCYDMLYNQHVSFLNNGMQQKGVIKGIDNLGGIIIEIDGAVENLYSAQVQEIKPI